MPDEKGNDKAWVSREEYDRMELLHRNNIGGQFTLEETDEAIVVRGTCGTGGRYVREAGTARDSEGVPYYCVHCPIWWQEMPKEFGINLTFEMGNQGVGCAWRLQK